MAQSTADTGTDSERTLTMARAGREAVFSEMRRNPKMFLIGEDIAKLGGVFGTSIGMAEEFGTARVIDTPISETGFIGIATGAAMAGMRPVVEIAFVDFIGVCFNAIFNFAAKTHYMSGGQFKVPLTFMIGYGGGYNDAAQHSQTLFATLGHVPGIKIVTPADAYDAKGLMHSCLRDDNLTVWMVHKRWRQCRRTTSPFRSANRASGVKAVTSHSSAWVLRYTTHSRPRSSSRPRGYPPRFSICAASCRSTARAFFARSQKPADWWSPMRTT